MVKKKILSIYWRVPANIMFCLSKALTLYIKLFHSKTIIWGFNILLYKIIL